MQEAIKKALANKCGVAYKVISKGPRGLQLKIRVLRHGSGLGPTYIVVLQKFGPTWDIVQVNCPDGWPANILESTQAFCRQVALGNV